RLIFKARTKGGGRGLTGNKVILDEAFALLPTHMGALLPTLSAVEDPQVLYGSSAGKADAEVLAGIAERGRVGEIRLGYAEWSIPRGTCKDPVCEHKKPPKHLTDYRDWFAVTGCALDDPENWKRVNTAVNN